MDTWVVAVNPAVVQDEWDAVQVSHLKEAGQEKCYCHHFHSSCALFHCGSRPNFSRRPSKTGETAELQEKKVI